MGREHDQGLHILVVVRPDDIVEVAPQVTLKGSAPLRSSTKHTLR